MYVRMREIYFSKKTMPFFVDLIRKLLIFAFIGGVVITILTPVRIQNAEQFGSNSIYLVFNNHFFINFIIEKNDLVILGNNKKSFQSKLLTSILSLLSFNFYKSSDEMKIYKIIAVKGDQINLKSGILYVNDKKASESISTALHSDFTKIVGENEVFYISLEKNTLSDSLLYGTTTIDKIEGKIVIK